MLQPAIMGLFLNQKYGGNIMKSESLLKINELLNKELFTTDNLTIDEFLNVLKLEWNNITEDDKIKVSKIAVGIRKGNHIILKNYIDSNLKI